MCSRQAYVPFGDGGVAALLTRELLPHLQMKNEMSAVKREIHAIDQDSPMTVKKKRRGPGVPGSAAGTASKVRKHAWD